MTFFLSVLLLLVWQTASAAEGFPPTCLPVAVQQESVMLKAKQPMMVLIHNLSKGDLWITHPVVDASAGWSSRLEMGAWSALVVEEKSFEISCIESKPGHEQQVPCVGAVELCQWKGIKMTANAQGSFWAGENMSLSTLVAELGGRGYRLPASAGGQTISPGLPE